MQEQLLVSASPHVHERDTIKSIMWNVALALLPAVAMSIYFFGAGALGTYVMCVGTALVAEWLCLRMRGKPASHALDGSAVVTGLLFAMVIPPYAAWYVCVVGSAFAIAIAKHTFGGLGNNIWNPALAARVFVQFSYAGQLNLGKAWPMPRLLWEKGTGVLTAASPMRDKVTDAVTMATPLARGSAERAWGYLDLFMGNAVTGCLGETCKLALICGGIYLIVKKIIDWRVPVFYIGTVALLTWLLPLSEKRSAETWANDALYQVLSGGLIIGAFFMATDMVTTPVTPLGRIIFAVGCGLLVAVIRLYGGYPEGVCYSILLMNTATPLIDRWVRPRVYGSKTPKPGANAA